MEARLLIAVVLLSAAVLCHSSSVDLSNAPAPRADRLLQQASQLQKAEAADCGSVKHIARAEDKCEFVKQHCAGGSIISYVEIYFCSVKPAGALARFFYQVAVVLWLLLLFRVLGSTAENFFSPILTQLSQEMGLPPRFAGVSFLALGNGAPDISASIAAISSGNYELALGALLGGGLFVGAVIAGAIMLVNGGAKARGALLRDVAALGICVITITAFLSTGRMSYARCAVLLAEYVAFVLIVLGADLWHIFTRKDGAGKDGDKPQEVEPLLEEHGDHEGKSVVVPPPADLFHPARASATATVEGRHRDDMSHASDTSIELTERRVSSKCASGPASHDSAHDNRAASTGLHEQVPHHHVKQWLHHDRNQHMSGRAYRQHALAELSNSATFDYRGSRAAHRQASMEADILEETDDRDAHANVPSLGYQPPSLHQEDDVGEPDIEAAHHIQHEQHHPGRSEDTRGGLEQHGTPEQSLGSRWKLLRSGLSKAVHHLDAAAEVLEWPLTILRKATIPLLERDCYSRTWFLISLAMGPPAVIVYLELSLFAIAMALCAGVLVAALAAWATSKSTDEPPEWGCGLPFPVGAAVVAAGGFLVAALWIDTIATELVSIIEYLGLLSGINHTVLGLTVLAWGNSIGDFSTNMAMARKGLANMALTACYAGPVFNLLVGVSVGFIRLLAKKSIQEIAVGASENVVISCVAALVMCVSIIATAVFCRYKLPASFGIFTIGLYSIYVVTCVVALVF